MISPAAPGVLAVTGSAFRPVQQSAYMIRAGQGGPVGGHGGGSSTDSCVKPDASSTSSNNETTTNNEHSVGLYTHRVSVIVIVSVQYCSRSIAQKHGDKLC